MTVVVLAEKPSVARDIARVLGASRKQEGFFMGAGYAVTWAVGHLVTLAQPHEVNAGWKRWRVEDLPMIPAEWPLVTRTQTRKQFSIVKKLLNANTTKMVICATDAGREGELIFRYIYERAGCNQPIKRLWISSLTPEAIRAGFARLEDGAAYDNLAAAARGRSQADWLVGMNLSRAYTLTARASSPRAPVGKKTAKKGGRRKRRGSSDVRSVGRVQTPTLSMLVERELAIRDFVPEDYLEVQATFRPRTPLNTSTDGDAIPDSGIYVGTYFDPEQAKQAKQAEAEARDKPGEPKPDDKRGDTRLPADGEQAAAIIDRAQRGAAVIERIDRTQRTMPPPRLYDLTELQRHANRLYGFSAKRTLDLAQALYEKHKLISYPRTDSRYLSRDVSATLPAIVTAIAAPYEAQGIVAPGSGTAALPRRYVDDGRVGDHHAIIPTSKPASKLDPDSPEGKIYDLICRRLLSIWHEDHVYATTTVITAVTFPPPKPRDASSADEPEGGPEPFVDRFRSRGSEVVREGWKVLDIKTQRRRRGSRKGRGDGDDERAQPALPSGLARGQAQDVLDARAVEKQTRPPPRFTESTLLTAMETAGRALEDRELSDAMREKGLGTPATRAATIETLLDRSYIERKGKSLHATPRGVELIAAVHEQVKSPALTGAWEHRLRQIERGEADFADFMREIEDFVRAVVGEVTGVTPAPAPAPALTARAPTRDAPSTTSRPPARAAPRRETRTSPRATQRARATAAAEQAAAQTSLFPQMEQTMATAPRRSRARATTTTTTTSPSRTAARPAPRASAPPPGRAPARAPQRAAAATRPPDRAGPPPEFFDRAPPPDFFDRPPPETLLEAPPADRFSAGPPPDAFLESFDELASAPPPGPPARPAEAPARPRQGTSSRATTITRAAPQAGARRPPTPPERLGELLREVFKFPGFRPHQEAVCRSVTRGEHVLLVMPTGAGKSLCYQLPGLARGGTTLVVSPLIALMEDQVGKLQGFGLAADRIHSGRERGSGSQVYRDYLAGRLDYLFIAPERLGVPGFVDMLARRKPSLIAIDEAHCISQWGHDFRPDYRMLGERLPQLQPTPIIALTATATPTVQRDIIRQLGLEDTKPFIHGFRRDNIAVEVANLPTKERGAVARDILSKPGRLPAIIYAPTRKIAESVPSELGDGVRAASYHAGMDGGRRERVQTRFLAGELDVIVATIAFGMGIDKPDVRTVIHMALPGSVEGYYQEIGRAGRDGKMSRAVMMHSYADHRTHEYFTERDYPDPAALEDVFDRLGRRPRSRESLARSLRIDRDELDRRLQKLWVHGGAQIDADDGITRGHAGWERSYVAQRTHKQTQLVRIAGYAESPRCRMLQLVEHFGDQEDSGEPCGVCDVCAPKGCVAQRTRESRADERAQLARILDRLLVNDRQTVGKLFRDGFDGALDRRDFEGLLAALARARLVKITENSFQKNGRTISYRRVELTRAGRETAEGDAKGGALAITITESKTSGVKKRKKSARKRGKSQADDATIAANASPELVDALTEWRKDEAKRLGIPAYRILTNKTLMGIAAVRPRDRETMSEVKGVGPKLLARFADDILQIVRDY